jgi:hypothetical protein
MSVKHVLLDNVCARLRRRGLGDDSRLDANVFTTHMSHETDFFATRLFLFLFKLTLMLQTKNVDWDINVLILRVLWPYSDFEKFPTRAQNEVDGLKKKPLGIPALGI